MFVLNRRVVKSLHQAGFDRGGQTKEHLQLAGMPRCLPRAPGSLLVKLDLLWHLGHLLGVSEVQISSEFIRSLAISEQNWQFDVSGKRLEMTASDALDSD